MERTASDRCPGNLALHQAQDGWLARVRIPGGRVTADQLRALARAAALGNRLVELTSRANLQLRGFPSSAGPELAEIVTTAGLLPSPAHDRARNVIASPLAGRCSRARTDPVVAGIDRAVCADPALAELPGRFLFAVDDGSGLALDRVADVALIARDEASYTLALAGRATAEPVAAAAAAQVAVDSAAAFLAERGGAWRISELDGGPATVARRLGAEIAGPVTPPLEPLRPGVRAQRDGRVAVTALAPLGRLDGDDLVALAQLAPEIRIGTGRTLTVLDVDRRDATAVRAELESLGLVLAPASGWVGLTACAGLGRCPKARLDVLAAATARARSRRAGAPAEHWAACERRCGERAGQATAVAPAGGQLAVRTGETETLVADLESALEGLG